MGQRTTNVRKLTHLLFAGAFVVGTQGQAVGIVRCPLHDSAPSPESHSGPSVAGHGSHGDRASTELEGLPLLGGAEQHPHHAGVSAGCLDGCHTSSSGRAALGEPSSVPFTASLGAAGSVAGERSILGPRHAPFELHLPNAPPLSA